MSNRLLAELLVIVGYFDGHWSGVADTVGVNFKEAVVKFLGNILIGAKSDCEAATFWLVEICGVDVDNSATLNWAKVWISLKDTGLSVVVEFE